MVEKISEESLHLMGNRSLRDYASRYIAIENSFCERAECFGVAFAKKVPGDVGMRAGDFSNAPSVHVRNDGKSAFAAWRSSACDACRLGIGTETFVLTLQCPHRCFFCFNPNQADFDDRRPAARDVCRQLEMRAEQGAAFTHVALTGGEPLLFPEESVAFVHRAKELFPGVHVRLYTSGFGATDEVLHRMAYAGLDEIRFSVKTDQGMTDVEKALEVIGSAVDVIPDVLVEMPVMPDEIELMRDLLVRLDDLRVKGINLLELGFPFFNGDEFSRRGYELKPDPYRVLYDYSYAGGLPIDGSERACAELLEFTLGQNLSLGVHYCSMENKHTGQIYRQNARSAALFPLRSLSARDYFLKSAKTFGDDRAPVREVLSREGVDFDDVDELDFTEFPLEAVSLLQGELPDIELAISYAVCESRNGEVILRELRLDKTTPATFDFAQDW